MNSNEPITGIDEWAGLSNRVTGLLVNLIQEGVIYNDPEEPGYQPGKRYRLLISKEQACANIKKNLKGDLANLRRKGGVGKNSIPIILKWMGEPDLPKTSMEKDKARIQELEDQIEKARQEIRDLKFALTKDQS